MGCLDSQTIIISKKNKSALLGLKSFNKSREGVVVFHPFYQQAESLLFGIKSLFKNQYFNVWSQIEQI